MFNLVPTSASLPPSLLEVTLYKTIFTGKKKKLKMKSVYKRHQSLNHQHRDSFGDQGALYSTGTLGNVLCTRQGQALDERENLNQRFKWVW